MLDRPNGNSLTWSRYTRSHLALGHPNTGLYPCSPFYPRLWRVLSTNKSPISWSAITCCLTASLVLGVDEAQPRPSYSTPERMGADCSWGGGGWGWGRTVSQYRSQTFPVEVSFYVRLQICSCDQSYRLSLFYFLDCLNAILQHQDLAVLLCFWIA